MQRSAPRQKETRGLILQFHVIEGGRRGHEKRRYVSGCHGAPSHRIRGRRRAKRESISPLKNGSALTAIDHCYCRFTVRKYRQLCCSHAAIGISAKMIGAKDGSFAKASPGSVPYGATSQLSKKAIVHESSHHTCIDPDFARRCGPRCAPDVRAPQNRSTHL